MIMIKSIITEKSAYKRKENKDKMLDKLVLLEQSI